MAISKITDTERKKVRIEGLNDVPGLDAKTMQQRFDGLGNLAIDKLNEVIEAVNAIGSATNINTTIVNEEGNVENVNTVLNNLVTQVTNLTNRMEQLVVSVDELPEEQQDGVIYVVKGEVTVE